MKKLSVLIISVLMAALLLAGCISQVPGSSGISATTAPTVEQTEAPTETTAPAPTETVKVCQHEWAEHPYRLHTALCTQDGEEFFMCNLCGEEKAEPKEAIGHAWVRERYVSGECAAETAAGSATTPPRQASITSIGRIPVVWRLLPATRTASCMPTAPSAVSVS